MVQTSMDPYIVPRLSEGSTRSNGNTAVRRQEAAHGPKNFPLPSGHDVKGHPSPMVTKPTPQTARLLYPNFRSCLRFSRNESMQGDVQPYFATQPRLKRAQVRRSRSNLCPTCGYVRPITPQVRVLPPLAKNKREIKYRRGASMAVSG